MTAHWGVPDPAEATGTEAEIALAFTDAYRMLNQRIGIFTALPIRSLDQLTLQSTLREIGRMRRRHRQGRGTSDRRSRAARRGGSARHGVPARHRGRLRASWRSGWRAETLRWRCSCNTLPTGAILVVLILIFGPVSGAHFNPVVSAGFCAAPRNALAGRCALYRGADCRRHRSASGRRI